MKPSNVSAMEIDCNLKRLYSLNHSTQNPWHYIFIGLYALVTLSGFICNTILLIALQFVHSKKSRRGLPLSLQNIRLPIHPRPSEIRRDALISQLAILDLLLCISMPFTAVDGLTKFWPFGSDTELLCKMVKAFPTTIVYAAAMTMMLIAFNCYRWTVLPHKRQIPTAKLKYLTLSFIIISLLLSSPQYYFTKIFHPQADHLGNIMYNRTNIPESNANTSNVDHVDHVDNVDHGNHVHNVEHFGHIDHVDHINHVDHVYHVLSLLSSHQVDPLDNIMYNRTYIAPVNANKSNIKPTSSPSAFLSANTSKEFFGVQQTRPGDEVIDECTDLDENGWDHVEYCLEDWPFGQQRFDTLDRLMYSIVSFIIQLVVPLVTLSICYCLIYIKLREQSRLRRSSSNWDLNERWQMEEIKRLRKNKNMASISIIYLLIWMPLGILSIVLDANPSIFGTDTSHITIIYLSAHLLGMLGATSNPIIYIWKYEHIRKGENIFVAIILFP